VLLKKWYNDLIVSYTGQTSIKNLKLSKQIGPAAFDKLKESIFVKKNDIAEICFFLPKK
jgi:hypothetical protein